MHIPTRWLRTLLTFAVIVVVSQAFVGTAFAAEPLNLTISPVTMFFQTKPGEVSSTTLKVRNNSSQLENLKIDIGTFKADSTGEHPELIDASAAADPASMTWLNVSEPTFSVAPGEWKNVQVTFTPPETAALSYFYTILISRSRTSAVSSGGETVIEGAPAVLTLATVETPNAKRELTVESFTAPSFQEFLPVEFKVKVKNTGNVFVIPSGNIFLDGQGKKDVAVLAFNPASSAILPQTSREFTVRFEKGFPVWQKDTGEESGQKLSWDFSQAHLFRFGKYSSHLLLVYDNGLHDVPIESFVGFWIVPVRLILGIILVPVIPAALVYLFMRWRWNQWLKKNAKARE